MKLDKILLFSIITISIFGLIMVYSSSYTWAEYKYNDSFKFVRNQFIFLVIGIVLMIKISKINYKIYYKKSNIILFTFILLLILVLIPGIGSVRNGSRSWFGIGSFGIQPSEGAKLGLIIFISKYISDNLKKINIFKILGITLFIFLLIMLQPDFGTGFILVVTVISLIFISGTNIKFFIRLGILGIGGVIGLIMSAPYRLERILSFLNPWKDPLGSGFQIIQSLYAIGPGGLFGLGFLNSIQKHFYLPEPETDFIFSIISEEFGFMGVLIVSSLFLIIIYRCFRISLHIKEPFGKFLSFGISFLIGFQSLLNLMVVVGLVPVTGVTLPFLSYGGSSLLISMISMGIILNISRYI